MFNPFKKTKFTRMLFFIAVDMAVVAFSVWLAFYNRFDGQIPSKYDPFLFRIILLAWLFVIPIFYFKKLYSFSWSYVSTNELISLFLADTMAFALLAAAIYVSVYFPGFVDFPRSTLLTSYMLVFVLCGLARFSKRIWLNLVPSAATAKREKTLIAGAGDAGEQILRNILSLKHNPHDIVGFVDDNSIKQGVAIHGVKVLGTISDIPKLVLRHQIKQLIVALPSANTRVIGRAIELGRQAGLRKIKNVPPLNETIGEVSLKDLRDVDAEDLLGRSPIDLDETQIEKFLKGRVVLVTGAAGSIGSELAVQAAKFSPSSLLLLDQDETGIFSISKKIGQEYPNLRLVSLVADVADQKKISTVFSQFRPQVVFHAAAYKHVPLMEDQPDQAVKNNIFGTENLARASADHGVETFVFISTDKAVNPSSVMGATKRIGEMICQIFNRRSATRFVSVRFGNVLDSRGSVIPIFREQIRRRGPVEVTHPEMKRYFMLCREACLLVMQAGAMGKGGEVFVLDMGKPVNILDLAREMIRLSGLKPDKDIAIVFTGPRPGEKLFEEMLTAEEGVVSTLNQNIFAAKLAEFNLEDFSGHLDRLREIADTAASADLIAALKRIAPYYR
jgi:FlaA1/EpsC-like NDP-sugar epimerase